MLIASRMRRAGWLGLVVLGMTIWVGPVAAQSGSTITYQAGGTPLATVDGAGNTTFDIRVEDGDVRGTNLFQRFTQFDVGVADTARFLTNPDTANVIALVNGPASLLRGGVVVDQSSGFATNFFLLNPAGITVENTATFQVPGRLTLAAADRLVFDDGSFVSATGAAGSSLTIANPVDFGFLPGDTGGQLALRGNTGTRDRPGLDIVYGDDVGPAATQADVQALTLVGTNVLLDGAIIENEGPVGSATPGGRPVIEIIARDRAELTGLINGADPDRETIETKICTSCERAPTDIRDLARADQRPAGGGGLLSIVAGDVILSGDAQIIADALVVDATTGAEADASTTDLVLPRDLGVTITAENGVLITERAKIFSRARSSAQQPGTDVTISGRQVRIDGTELIVAQDDGSLRTISNSAALTFTTDAPERGGNLTITAAESLDIMGDSRLFAGSQDTVLDDTPPPAPNGEGGTITLTAPRIEVAGQARLESGTNAEGRGGVIRIVDGERPVQSLRIVDEAQVLSNAGIDIAANRDGASDRALSNWQIVNNTVTGNGGLVEIAISGDVQLGATVAARSFRTNQPAITVDNPDDPNDRVGLSPDFGAPSNGSLPGGVAEAGTIRILARSLTLLPGGVIDTQSDVSGGGNVTIGLSGDAVLRRDARIRTDVVFGAGAGNVDISARQVVLLNGASVTTTADGLGTGGDIAFSGLSFVSQGAVLDADSRLGLSGSILLTDGEELVADFGSAPPDVADPRALTADPCQAEAEGRSAIAILKGSSARAARVDLPAFFLGAVPFPEEGEAGMPGAAAALASAPCQP